MTVSSELHATTPLTRRRIRNTIRKMIYAKWIIQESAHELVDDYADLLTPEQREEAERLANQFLDPQLYPLWHVLEKMITVDEERAKLNDEIPY
jgi:hypothetical protein